MLRLLMTHCPLFTCRHCSDYTLIFVYYMFMSCVLADDSLTETSYKVSTEKISTVSSQHGKNTCRTGQFARTSSSGEFSCIPCPQDLYMDVDNHNYTECKKCTAVEVDLHEVLIQNCTPFSDTIIGCVKNYFKDITTGCKACTKCEFVEGKRYEALPCNPDNNTRCCPHPNMDIEWVNDGHTYRCVNNTRTTTDVPHDVELPHNQTCNDSVVRANGCLAGEYRTAECHRLQNWIVCKPCHHGTFNNLTLHNRTSCIPCSLPTEVGYEVMSTCDGYHDKKYDKGPNYYILLIILPVALIIVLTILVIFFFTIFKRKGPPAVGRSRQGTDIVSTDSVEDLQTCKDQLDTLLP